MTFIKGHIGYNKGLKLSGEYRNCLRCDKEIWFVTYRLEHGGGKYCSRDCSNKSTAIKGEENPNYKKEVGYYGIHTWLLHTFGNPKKCEQCGKIGGLNKGKKWNIQWAKVKGKNYERKRENFMGLCARCHVLYDETIPYKSKGVPVPTERKIRISNTLKEYFKNKS